MQLSKHTWILGALLTLVVLVAPLVIFLPRQAKPADDPWSFVPQRLPHTDHSDLFTEPLTDGPSVTRACLECHPEAAEQMLRSVHWTWEREPVAVEGRAEPVAAGKKTMINNFCIGIQSNWPPCTACHAGYGWVDETFDFTNTENIDCLVCHDRSGAYVKANGGHPAEGVDLLAAAGSVGQPTRENCGGCHFRGGGGDAVKHGDLDESLYYPTESVDVHMGKHDFVCTDCHQAQNHEIKGRSITVSLDDANQAYCTDCHDSQLHDDERINAHVQTVACQTCHIPFAAVKQATKTHWDWSKAGDEAREDDPHEYLKIKGEFVYERNIVPEYRWYSGTAERYLLGDLIEPQQVTSLNTPKGNIADPEAKIFPFKIHQALQIYDTEYNHLLQPKTAGEGGYWTEFDWDQAARLGSETVGLAYSGEFGFTSTEMYWPIAHMVAPIGEALQCAECHADEGEGRMDWLALGYDGDPMFYGGRSVGAQAQPAPQRVSQGGRQ